MSRTTDPLTAVTGRTTGREPPATAAEVRQVYQALRTLVPDRGRVSAADLAVVTDLERERVPAAMAHLVSEGPFGVERADQNRLPTWEVER